jgi:adenylate cyclase
METKPIETLTVMFADVAGSTKLYEQLGDVLANSIISEVIQLMSDAIKLNNGILIKTIGDEVMCRFGCPDDCANAAIQIQEQLQLGLVQNQFVAVRIGFHSGPAIIQDDGDIFGDTVNTAARMAGIAKGRQIILTSGTAQKLSTTTKDKTRECDRVHVKGKADALLISELVWENAGVTQMVSFGSLTRQLKQYLHLTCGKLQLSTDTDSHDIQLGRSDNCDLVVDAKLASRFHAKIGVRRGSFVLSDQSTNGTYIQTEDGTVSFLRRDDINLHGKGVISLGEQMTSDTAGLIHYQVTDNS